MSATPINLPNVAEDPDHGPNPITDTAQVDQTVGATEEELNETAFKVETPRTMMEDGKEQIMQSEEEEEEEEEEQGRPIDQISSEIDDEVLDEGSFKFFTPLPDQENMEVGERDGQEEAVLRTEISEHGVDADIQGLNVEEGGDADQTQDGLVPEMESATETLGEDGELDQDAPDSEEEESLDSLVELSPEEMVGEGEMLEDLKDVKEIGPDWYIHEDGDGNKTIVDADGNPVKSPPVLYEYKGKDLRRLSRRRTGC